MPTKLNSSWIVITGGAKRIGFALAQHFAQQGKNVLISYRTFYPQLAQLHALNVVSLQADFATEQGIIQFAEQVQQQCPQIDCLIHNASSWQAEQDQPMNQLGQLMDEMLQVHVKAPYLLNQLLAPLLQRTKSTSNIIHISDYVAHKGSAKHIAYAASKAAMENLTQSFAQKYAPHIKVNSIAPALIAFNPDDDLAYQQKAQQKSLMQKCGGYQEMILAVEYLMQSDYVTGTCLAVNGGRHLK
ncbi:dihydromonapterin reductase [Volucribacter amazonae]|uniref:Dihydromonapterin reductase n=1 Tax=Volucribacter amazonae TaxID=256731 RepID=A0A9X4PBZ1_9PAST|nr:dihydromonapterin reductase [Volucribacter amazonae]MDG6894454.1 dihydromonapterin reductase [Volucribacter amazonae]